MDSCDGGARLEQRHEALRQANMVRGARARLKERIAAGEVSAADVVVSGRWELNSMPIEALLTSQRGWGQGRCTEFLKRTQIRETKTIGSMTERQRALVATVLNSVQRYDPVRGVAVLPSGREVAPALKSPRSRDPS